MVDIKSVISEAIGTHKNAVHYSPHKGSHKQFKIHKVGANFQSHVKTGDVVPSSAIDDLADAGAKLKQIKEAVEELDESSHMAVHVYPTSKSHSSFKVHKVGPGVEHVKVGDTVSSSDLDDLSDAGHKVKEVKAPAMKEEAEELRAEDMFEKGDRVRDIHGNNHTVLSVTHPMLNMASGKSIHHTKVFKTHK